MIQGQQQAKIGRPLKIMEIAQKMPAPNMVTPGVQPVAPPQILATHFGVADFTRHGQWLLDRLCLEWPHWSQANHLGNLRTYMSSNAHCILKTENAVGMAMVRLPAMAQQPIIEVVFLFQRKPDCAEDIKSVFREMERWGKRLSAMEIRPGEHCDAVDVLECTGRRQLFRKIA